MTERTRLSTTGHHNWSKTRSQLSPLLPTGEPRPCRPLSAPMRNTGTARPARGDVRTELRPRGHQPLAGVRRDGAKSMHKVATLRQRLVITARRGIDDIGTGTGVREGAQLPVTHQSDVNRARLIDKERGRARQSRA